MVKQSRAPWSIPGPLGEMRGASWGARLGDKRAPVEQRSFQAKRIRIWDLLNSYEKNLARTRESWILAFSMTSRVEVGGCCGI